MTSLGDKLRKAGVKKPVKREPLWEGPESDGPQGGVTQSLLGRFLVCRERFRVQVVEGLKARDTFRPQIEYGNMWHVCEEAFAAGDNGIVKPTVLWQSQLTDYCRGLAKEYPLEQEQVNHWYGLCKTFFPLYVKHWSQHPDVKNRTPLLQEETFRVPYQLPSGRTVYLRGKWDSVDVIGKSGIFIQENKTKSTIDRVKLARFLRFDLQSMFYVIAVTIYANDTQFKSPLWQFGAGQEKPLGSCGVRYNVIRRPAHKSVESALEKYEKDVKAGRHEEWFCRFMVEVSPKDVAEFRRRCLDPVLEQLCVWYEHVTCETGVRDPFDSAFGWHFQMPYGIYNPLTEGGSCDVDGYLEDGSEVGLTRAETLFPEL